MFKSLTNNIKEIQKDIENIKILFNKLITYINDNANNYNTNKNNKFHKLVLTNTLNKNNKFHKLVLTNTLNKINDINLLKENLFQLIEENSKIINNFNEIEKNKIHKINLFLFKENENNLKILEYITQVDTLTKNKLDTNLNYIENIKKGINLDNKNTILELNNYLMYLITNKTITIYNSNSLDNIIKQYNQINYIFELNKKNKTKNKIIKTILTGITAATIGLFTIHNTNHEISKKDLNKANIEQIQEIKKTISKPENKLIENPKKKENNQTIIFNDKKKNIKLHEEIFNPRFNEKQIKYLKLFYNEFENDNKKYKKEFLDELIKYSILKGDILRLNFINRRLYEKIFILTQKENINLNLVLFTSLIESSFGKYNKSPMGAIGPLQVLPKIMLANCKNEYSNTIKKYGEKKGKELFFSDLNIQIIAGIRELKNIAKQYHFDISYNTKEIDKYNLIILAASYNSGRGNIKKKPQKLIKNRETLRHITKILTLNEYVHRVD